MDLRSILGYQRGSPYAGNPYLDINTPDGLIDMSNTPIDLIGIDNKGNKKKMKAGRRNPYKFEGDVVREIPMKQGGLTQSQYNTIRGLVDAHNKGDFDNISANKARKILHAKKLFGKKLTPEQFKLFGYLSKGNSMKYQQGGVTPQNMQDWNSFIDFLDKEGYRGSADLDIRDKNLSRTLLDKYRKANPTASINYDMVPAFQQEFVNYRQKVIDDFKAGKAGISGLTKENYAQTVGEDFSGLWPEISKTDGWLGSKTSKWKFPNLYIHTKSQQGNELVQNAGLQKASTIPFQKGGFTARDLYKYLFEDDSYDEGDDYEESENTAPSDAEIAPEEQMQQEPDEYAVALQMAMQQDEFMVTERNPYIKEMASVRAVGANPYTPVKEANISNPTKYAFEYFKNKGLPPHIAAGIVGNLMQESGNFRPDVITDEITGDKGMSHGIAQWQKNRWPAFLNWASSQGKNPKTLDAQLEYVYVEATQRGDLGKVATAKTSSEAANLFAKYYERPAVIDKNRSRNARQLFPD